MLVGWYMTLFTSLDTLPLSTVVAFWDLFLIDGWKALHRFALAILSSNEVSAYCRSVCSGPPLARLPCPVDLPSLVPPCQDLLLDMDMGDMVQFLRTLGRHNLPDTSTLLARAMEFKVTNTLLRKINEWESQAAAMQLLLHSLE